MVHKRSVKSSANGKKSEKSTKTARATNGTSKMTMCTVPLMAPRSPVRERRTDRRIAGKRIAMNRSFSGKLRAASRRGLDPCDNSNDSGLGFDNHVDQHTNLADRLAWPSERGEAKRPRLDIKLEDDEINDNFSFPETVKRCKDNSSIIHTAPSGNPQTLNLNGAQSCSGSTAPRGSSLNGRTVPSTPVTLVTPLSSTSRQADISLKILSQPEQQHRARYQTEGSRGAVKDRSGNGFPVVRLHGYNKPATLQIFIGTDVGKVSPHMFYQACRVSGKNSTPCTEKKLDGTVVIELQLDPTKDMVGTCDCVGILKERNVDVEHRFPDQIGSRSKKKSTRCRMIFRTCITHENGAQETLQICSNPIVCTQPPGIPEICKKSLSSCSAVGGQELFILGKNFLKDTKIFFQQVNDDGLQWEQYVVPDKEFLQQTHLVCVVPPYLRSDITEPVTVRLLVVSSGKTSEPHQFVYTPTNGSMSSVYMDSNQSSSFINKMRWSSLTKHEQGMMPPPDTNQMPNQQRRSSISISSDIHSPPIQRLKQEITMDESSMESIELQRERYKSISESSLDLHSGDANMKMINENSMDLLHQSTMDAISQSINENSMSNSMSNGGMEMLVHKNSSEVPLVNTGINLNESNVILSPNHSRMPVVPIMREDLTVMDLRMKMPSTVADLAHMTGPSLATLQSFGVTEHANAPLPAQTAQSVENYLSTIETKPVNVDAMALSNSSALQMTHILNSTPHSSLNSSLPVQSLLGTSTTSMNAISSHLVVNNSSPNASFTTNQNLLIPVSMVEANETQDMLISNKSPQDMLMHSPTQASMLVSSISPNSMESTEVNNTTRGQSPNLSSEIILNSQISPTMMCRNSTNLSQEGLLSSICQTTVTDTGLIQPQMTLSETVPLLTTQSSQVHLSSVMNVNDPEKAILINAAVDLLATQKKLSELDATSPTSQMEHALMNSMSSNSNKTMLDNKQTFSVPTVNGGEKQNEDRMIPAYARLSDNELIDIINPSCFDQVL